jgi:tetratricopeptide (TPR) repeat protein
MPAAYLNLSAGLWLATAGVGAWAAYDRLVSMKLLALAVGGVMLLYVLAGLALDDLWVAAGIFACMSVLLVVYFLLTHDWQRMPADVAVLNRLGIAWMQIRPTFSRQWFHPNMVGGILASLFPMVLALALQQRRQPFSWRLAAAGLAVLVIGVGLIMTSSRAAWAILAVALGIWWGLERWQSGRPRLGQIWLLTPVSGLLLILATGAAYLLSGTGFSAAVIPGSLSSRFELYGDALQLARDVFWLGGGLGAFSGLFSHYILQMHVPFYFYSHNLYLDVLIEQGIVGLLAWLGIFLPGVFFLLVSWKQKGRSIHPLALPVLAGSIILALHGLIDNPYYEPWSRPLLFLLMGMSAALVLQERIPLPGLPATGRNLIFLCALSLVVLGAMLTPLRSAWLANLGVIEMSRVQLAGWPENPPKPDDVVQGLAQVQPLFQQALNLDRNNFAAWYWIGLIAYQKEDYLQASRDLQAAEQLRPSHKGVRKELGLALTWVREEEQALERLAGIPGIVDEMAYYASWWDQQHRPDLSRSADHMVVLLSSRTQP